MSPSNVSFYISISLAIGSVVAPLLWIVVDIICTDSDQLYSHAFLQQRHNKPDFDKNLIQSLVYQSLDAIHSGQCDHKHGFDESSYSDLPKNPELLHKFILMIAELWTKATGADVATCKEDYYGASRAETDFIIAEVLAFKLKKEKSSLKSNGERHKNAKLTSRSAGVEAHIVEKSKEKEVPIPKETSSSRKYNAEEESILESIPLRVRQDFKQISFVKWVGRYLPVLQIGPFDIIANDVSKKWFEMFEEKSSKKKPFLRLIYWYGTEVEEAFSLIAANKLISYETGIKRNLHLIPVALQKKMDSGKKLNGAEERLIKGLGEMNDDAKLPPEKRSMWLIEGCGFSEDEDEDENEDEDEDEDEDEGEGEGEGEDEDYKGDESDGNEFDEYEDKNVGHGDADGIDEDKDEAEAEDKNEKDSDEDEFDEDENDIAEWMSLDSLQREDSRFLPQICKADQRTPKTVSGREKGKNRNTAGKNKSQRGISASKSTVSRKRPTKVQNGKEAHVPVEEKEPSGKKRKSSKGNVNDPTVASPPIKQASATEGNDHTSRAPLPSKEKTLAKTDRVQEELDDEEEPPTFDFRVSLQPNAKKSENAQHGDKWYCLKVYKEDSIILQEDIPMEAEKVEGGAGKLNKKIQYKNIALNLTFNLQV